MKFRLGSFVFSLFLTFSSWNLHSQTFVYCSEGSPSAFNPQITADGTSNNAAGQTIYDRLVGFEIGQTKIIPGLAESWSISKDGKSYIFKLRKGVKFHRTAYFTPTRNFNADDVLFSFNRMRDVKHPFNKVSGGTYEYFEAMEMGKLITDIAKKDEFTVEIKLARPESPFLANMAMSFMSILSQEYGDFLTKNNKKADIDNFPIGTGPFIFQSYSKDTLIRFNRNPDYFAGAPKIEKLVFAITPDSSVRYQKLKAGECHLIIEPSPADLGNMKNDKNIQLKSGPGLNVAYVAMNMKAPPFDKKEVRLAINHAINKKSLIDAIYMGHGIEAKNPLPPTIWSYNNDIRDYEYNLEKARELLKKAGFPQGFETEMWTLPVTRPYNPNGKKMGEIIQANLAQIGIKVKLVSFDWPTYLARSRKGEHKMIQMGWTGDNGDPDNFLNVLLGCAAVSAGSNYSQWCHKDFDKLMEDAKLIGDVKKRTQIYKKAQDIFHLEAPWIPIAHSVIFRAMSTKVKNYQIDPLGGDIFKQVELSQK